MFREALAIASGFTRPVVISSRTVANTCDSTIGTCVVINEDGWILTSAHLIGLIDEQRRQVAIVRKYGEDVRTMDRDRSSFKPFRTDRLHHLERPEAKTVSDHSVWWGADGVRLVDVRVDPRADLAAGRLEPFDPSGIVQYPVFKTAGADYRPGASLCRLGFPLHRIVPAYDEKRGGFVLPRGSVPLPLFPLDGILTRVLEASVPGGPDGETSLFIETSSPGLMGQSGGPIFDTDGAIWALQSHTRHYSLGFAPQVPGKRHLEHQFLNVGAGVHAEPMRQFLDDQGIAHRRTD